MTAPQGSDAWLRARLGNVTASCLCDVLAKLKDGKPAKTRSDYLMQLVCERLTGLPQPSYRNAAMEYGTEQEPFARMAYEAATGEVVIESEFVPCPDLQGYGASPDGLLFDADAGLEIKCPYNTAVHLVTVDKGRMPSEHVPQVQGNMLATGRSAWDFVSYDPRLPEHLQLFIQRIPRDEEYIATLRREITAFLSEVDAMVVRLNRRAA